MKRVLVIYPNYGKVITGGHVYDHYFIEHLRLNKNLNIDIYEKDPVCKSIIAYMFVFSKLTNLCKQYDIVISNSRNYSRLLLLFSIIRLFSKTKLILFHHHFSFMIEKRFNRFVHKLFEFSFISLSNSVIVPSPYVKDQMNSFFPNKNIHFISLAFNDNKQRESTLLNNNNLLYVGTIEPRKGIKYLLKSLALLKQENISFKLTLAGTITDMNYFNELKLFIKENDLEDFISFIGRVPVSDLEILYQNASCFVFPSLHEGYGMVLIEAMSYGVPVIGFNNSAIPYTLKHNKNGLLTENLNSFELKENIKKILKNIELRKKLSKGATNTYINSKKYTELDAEINTFSQLLEM